MIALTGSKSERKGSGIATLARGITFAEGGEALPMVEVLRLADKTGLTLASNKRLSDAFGSDEPGVREAYTCWSGTFVAYDKPDQMLGKYIEYVAADTGFRYVFPVPPEHTGKKNILLVAEHPGFRLESDGKDWIVLAASVDAVDRFPAEGRAWYPGDPKYDLPAGEKISTVDPDEVSILDAPDDPRARCLTRIDRYVGLVARHAYHDWNEDFRKHVSLCFNPSSRLGVVVEGTPEQIAAARLIDQKAMK